MNAPVQGTGADGLKAALIRIYESPERHKLEAVAIMAIHDEIVIEVPKERAKDAKAWLIDCMMNGMEEVLEEVPVTVAVEVRQTL